MKTILYFIVWIMLGFCGYQFISAITASEKKEVSIVQQYSGLMGEWHDVILVFGFWNNQAEAENVKAAYEKMNPGREYRITNIQITDRDLKKYRVSQR